MANIESDEYISVHEIESTTQSTSNEGNIPVYQVQGINNSSSGIIIQVGQLESAHDVLINEFKLLNKYKCYIVSRLFTKEEIDNVLALGIFQMIKIIICKDGDTMNMPLCYVCFNFNILDKLNAMQTQLYISTSQNKIELKGKYTITFHFKENNTNKYILLKTYDKFIGKDDMLNKLIKYLFNETILKELEKTV